jgi:hypothetical protein
MSGKVAFQAGTGASGRARGYKTERGQAVGAALRRSWAEGYAAPVTDAQLGGAIDAAMDHGIAHGALYERTERMRVEKLGDLEILLAPNRRAAGPEGKHVPGACVCPFCAPPNPEAKAVRWRDWDLIPNAFPYARLHSQHMLVVAARHVDQRFTPQILEDMLDLQGLIDGRNRTFHYNGWAGNSQPHLHWQFTKERFPVERALAETAKPLRSAQDGKVSTFDDGALAGIVIEGDKAFVVRMGAAIVKRLETDPICRDRYNLMLLPGDRCRLVVLPRRADAIVVDPGDGPGKISVVEAAGRLVAAADAIPAGLTAEGYREALRQTVVRPSELPWLAEVAGAPSDHRVRLRLPRASAP